MLAAILSLLLLGGIAGGPGNSSEVSRLGWVTLRVGDERAAAEWYAEHFDGRVERLGARWVVKLGDVELRFIGELPVGDKYDRGAIDHLAFADPDVAGRIEKLRASGVKILQRVQSAAGGSFRYSFVEDPWGGKIEILSDGPARGLHHLHLYSKQPDLVVDWWRAELGAPQIEPVGGFEHLRTLGLANVRLVVQEDKGERVRVASFDSGIYGVGWIGERFSTPSRTRAPDGVLVSFEPRR